MSVAMGIGIFIGVNMVVNPLTISFYVMSLGKCMGVEVENELGHVRNIKTDKLLNLYEAKKSIPFISDLSCAGFFPWLCFNPFALPLSCYYATTSTFNACNYMMYYKMRVENGEFDE